MCMIPTQTLKVASRAQNICFAPYLRPWEGHKSQKLQSAQVGREQIMRALGNHQKTLNAHYVWYAPALAENTLILRHRRRRS